MKEKYEIAWNFTRLMVKEMTDFWRNTTESKKSRENNKGT